MGDIRNELSLLIDPPKNSIAGVVGLNESVVEVNNRPGYIWVRYFDNLNEAVQCHNNKVSPAFGLPIFMTFDGNKYEVVGIDASRYSDWGTNASFIPPHAGQHSASRFGGGGGDILWVESQQFLPLVALPYGVTGSNSVNIAPYTFRNSQGNWIYAGNTGTVIPPCPSPTGSIIYLVMMRDSDGSFYTKAGNVFAGTPKTAAEFTKYLPVFTDAGNDVIVGAVRMSSTQTRVSWENLLDPRQFLNRAGSSAPTGSMSFMESINVYASGSYKGTAKSIDLYPDYTVSMSGTRAVVTYNDPIRALTKEPTGFDDTEAVLEFYNKTSRTITLSGTFSAYWRGTKVTALTSGWTSSAHPSGTGPYFLSYDGTNFNWDTTAWTFDKLQIAFIGKGAGTDKFGIRECHGLMPWQAHEEFHRTIGTYKESGGTLSGYTLDSTTATNRRPLVSTTIVHDEDIHSEILALSTGTYTQASLSSTGTFTFVTDRSDFINLTGALPYYNSYSAPNWAQTLVPLNNYTSVWLVGIPTTSDADSRKYRYVWMQGQSAGTLADQQALNPSSLNLADFEILATEFVFLSQVIIQRFGADWRISQVVQLSGNHYSQTSAPVGNFLTAVTTDSTLTGNGTPSSPLHVVITGSGGGSITIMEQDGSPTGTNVSTIVVSNNTLSVSGTSAYINNIGAMGIEPIDISSQITGSGMTHFDYSPAASNIVVTLNGFWQKPGAVTVDGDGLGFTLGFSPEVGDTMIVARVSPVSASTPTNVVSPVINVYAFENFR